MRQNLSQADVLRLLADPTPETRIELASKVSGDYGTEGLSEQERVIAGEVLKILVADVEVRVREALSSNLKEFPGLDHDIALSLANDVDTVALPMLQFSTVLADADLIEIVRRRAPTNRSQWPGAKRFPARWWTPW